MNSSALIAHFYTLGSAAGLLALFIYFGLVAYWNKFMRRPPTRRW